MKQLSLSIHGMSCDHCVARVRQALERLGGVQVENVDLGSATLTYDPALVSPERIRHAVHDAGYEARSPEAVS